MFGEPRLAIQTRNSSGRIVTTPGARQRAKPLSCPAFRHDYGGQDANTLVQLSDEPNVLADLEP